MSSLPLLLIFILLIMCVCTPADFNSATLTSAWVRWKYFIKFGVSVQIPNDNFGQRSEPPPPSPWHTKNEYTSLPSRRHFGISIIITCIVLHWGFRVRLCTSVLNIYTNPPVSSCRAILRKGSLVVKSFLSTCWARSLSVTRSCWCSTSSMRTKTFPDAPGLVPLRANSAVCEFVPKISAIVVSAVPDVYRTREHLRKWRSHIRCEPYGFFVQLHSFANNKEIMMFIHIKNSMVVSIV